MLGLDRAVVLADLTRAAEAACRQRALANLQAWAREVQTVEPKDLTDLLVRGQQVIDTLRDQRAVPEGTRS
jgi:hypothetical protein